MSFITYFYLMQMFMQPESIYFQVFESSWTSDLLIKFKMKSESSGNDDLLSSSRSPILYLYVFFQSQSVLVTGIFLVSYFLESFWWESLQFLIKVNSILVQDFDGGQVGDLGILLCIFLLGLKILFLIIGGLQLGNFYYYILWPYQHFMATQFITPLRNLSYNDIKKRRLLRESQSKSNVRLYCAPDTSIPRTLKKQIKNVDYSQRTNQKGTDLSFVKQLFVKKNFKKDQTKPTEPTTPFVKKQGLVTAQKSNLQDTHLNLASSRQIVRNLIEESKSERKLLRYNDLRNKFKLSKSRTKSVESILQKSSFATQRLQKNKTIENPSIASPNKNIKIRNPTKKDKTHRYLVLVPKQKQNQQVKTLSLHNKLEDQVQSSISVKKQSDIFDSQDQKILDQLSRKQISKDNGERILDLLSLQPEEMEKNLQKKAKQTRKINHELGKFAKKFPIGFFKI